MLHVLDTPRNTLSPCHRLGMGRNGKRIASLKGVEVSFEQLEGSAILVGRTHAAKGRFESP